MCVDLAPGEFEHRPLYLQPLYFFGRLVSGAFACAAVRPGPVGSQEAFLCWAEAGPPPSSVSALHAAFKGMPVLAAADPELAGSLGLPASGRMASLADSPLACPWCLCISPLWFLHESDAICSPEISSPPKLRFMNNTLSFDGFVIITNIMYSI